jgi:hypothetical protein
MATETYELAIQGLLASSYRETVLHFSGVGVASGDTLAAGESLINGFVTAAEGLFAATLPPTFSITGYRARRSTPAPSAVAHLQYPPGYLPGTRGSGSTSQQCCPSIFLVPTMGTKSGGKIFWPAVPQGDILDNVYGAAWKTAVDATIAALVAGFTNAGITWTLAIFSRKHLSTSTVAGHNYSPVIGFQSRRRKPTGAI